MARFYTRRDANPISTYAPLPLGLMQKTADIRQEKLDALKNKASENPVFKDVNAIETLTSSPGRMTSDYAILQQKNKEAVDRMSSIQDMIMGDNLEGAARELSKFNTWKQGEMMQTGSLYRVNESKKNRDKEVESIMKMDVPPEWKDFEIRKIDKKYEDAGEFKNQIYSGDAYTKYINANEELQKNAKSMELDLNKMTGSDRPTIDGFMTHATSGIKQKTQGVIAQSSLDLLNSNVELNNSVTREIEIKADDLSRAVLQKTGNKQLADAVYKRVINVEREAFGVNGYAIDKKGDLINTPTYSIPELEEAGMVTKGKKFGTVAGEYVRKAAKDYDILETQYDENKSQNPFIDPVTGNRKEPMLNTSRIEYDTKTRTYTGSDAMKELVNLEKERTSLMDEYKKAIANKKSGKGNWSDARIDQLATMLNDNYKKSQSINNAMGNEYKQLAANKEALVNQVLADADSNPNYRGKILMTLSPNERAMAEINKDFFKQVVSNKIAEGDAGRNILHVIPLNDGSQNQSTNPSKKTQEMFDAYNSASKDFLSREYNETTKPVGYSFFNPESEQYKWLKGKTEQNLKAVENKLEEEDGYLSSQDEIADKKENALLLGFDYDNSNFRLGYRTKKGKIAEVPITDFTSQDLYMLKSSIESDLTKSNLLPEQRQSLQDSLRDVLTFQAVGNQYSNVKLNMMNVGEPIDIYTNNNKTHIKFVKKDDYGVGGIFEAYDGETGQKIGGEIEGLGGIRKLTAQLTVLPGETE